jgi:hypothetical protein
MVLRQVRERRDVEDDAIDTVEVESVGGDLHRDTVRTAGAHRPQQTLEVGRLRRGARSGLGPTVQPCTEGPDAAAPPARSRHHRLEQERDGRLPVRPGHTEHAELARGIAVHERSDRTHRGPDRGDDELRDVEVERALHEQRRGTGRDRVAGVQMAVVSLPRDRAEQGARTHLPAVVRRIDVRIPTTEDGTRDTPGELGHTRGHGAPRTIGGPRVHGAGAGGD